MNNFGGIQWQLDGSEYQPPAVDELSERVIHALESLESILSEAAFKRRYDIIDKSIRTFSALTLHMVQQSAIEYERDHPNEPMQ
jgi:hypothetical protein